MSNYYTAEFKEKVALLYTPSMIKPRTYQTDCPLALLCDLKERCAKCGLIVEELRPATENEIKIYSLLGNVNKYPTVEVIGQYCSLRFI